MKHKRNRSRKRKQVITNCKGNVFRNVDATPVKFTETMCPTNVEEQKQLFLETGSIPGFTLKGSEEEVEKLANRARSQIRFDYLAEAVWILNHVKDKYGDGTAFIQENWGRRITAREGTEVFASYLRENGLSGQVTVYWTKDLTCSARMIWSGPNQRYNRPEARRYTLLIKNADDNTFLTQTGILCLADHEIGTHFFRTINDGLQPWYSDRKRFDLRASSTRQLLSSEEGLAAVNTCVNSKLKLLWHSALTYYTACQATEMTFAELYDHLGTFISSQDLRWKHVMRVKRSLKDPNELGGNGKDQCYFEGAVEILKNLDNIDLTVLYSGRICWDEVTRVKRVARTDCIKIPAFAKDMVKYRKILKHMAYINGLDDCWRRTSEISLSHSKLMTTRLMRSSSKSEKRCRSHRKKSMGDASAARSRSMHRLQADDEDEDTIVTSLVKFSNSGNDVMLLSNRASRSILSSQELPSITSSPVDAYASTAVVYRHASMQDDASSSASSSSGGVLCADNASTVASSRTTTTASTTRHRCKSQNLSLAAAEERMFPGVFPESSSKSHTPRLVCI